MRNTFDRIRHTISFEIIGLLVATPIGVWLFEMPLEDIGAVVIVGATIATVWNYIYNLIFDHALMHFTGEVRKTIPMRIAHAILFEVGLLIALMPFIAWHLQISLLEALVIDASFALFYIVYAFIFNWVYDRIFPVSSLAAPDKARD